MGSPGGRLRDPERTGQLPGVRRPPPPPGRGSRPPVARRGLRKRPRDRTGPIRGADCAGIDGRPSCRGGPGPQPGRDIRAGDMFDLPWERRKLRHRDQLPGDLGHHRRGGRRDPPGPRPGGRVAISVWGHLKVSPGVWALAPFSSPPSRRWQPGDPGLARAARGRGGAVRAYGFVGIERVQVPFGGSSPTQSCTPGRCPRTGPAYEAIQHVGEAEFHRAAVEQARRQLRDGLPLRAEINVVGYLARKPEGAKSA